MLTRLNKYIADSGYCSRRKADELIINKKVKINNVLVVDLSTKVKDDDVVSIDNKIIEPKSKNIYIMFHKPKGCVTTLSDELNRKTIFDYIDINERIYPIGRLDYDTEGLLLLTNDGYLANSLTHPSKEVPKLYQVTIKGHISEKEIKALRNGIMLDDKMTKKAFVEVVNTKKDETKLQIAITEGRNRQIRRMLEYFEKEVIFLKRLSVGDLRLGGLTRGKWRHLSQQEVAYLKQIQKQVNEN